MTTLDLYEKVAFARTILSRKFPYLTPLLYGMKLIEDMEASSNFSVSSDESGNIHWNPKAFDHMPQHMSPSPCMMTRVSEGVILTPPVNVLRDAEGKVQTAPITVGEMAGVLLHEYLHVVYKHIHRGREIDAKPFHWNLACFLENAKVETDVGYKNIEEIKEGDCVRESKGEFTKVVFVHKKRWAGDLVTITPYSGMDIVGTYDHKILVRSKRTKGFPIKLTNPYWKELGLVGKGDYIHLAIPSQYENKEISLPFTKYLSKERREILKGDVILDEEAAWCLGRYVADGSAGSEDSIQWTIGIKKIQDAYRICKWVASLGYTPQFNKQKGNTIKVGWCCRAAVQLFSDMAGRGAHNKKIPNLLWDAEQRIVSSFLEGWKSGDALKVKNGVYNGWTCSEVLALGLQRLALKCGEVWGATYKRRIRALPGSKVKTEQTGYLITTPSLTNKTGTVRYLNGKIIRSSNLLYKKMEDGIWLKVNKVSKKHTDNIVYTLTTESGMYTVSNYTVKNCDISVNRLLVEADIPCIPGHVAYQTLLPEYQRRIRLDSASVPAIYDVIKDCPLLQNQSCTMCGGSKQHNSTPQTTPESLPSEDSSPSTPPPTQENEYSYTNLDNKVEQVLDQMEAHPGTLPGVLKALLKGRAPKGVVPWQDILRARLSQAVTMVRGGGHRTYQKPSRRHDTSDLIRPRYLSPKQVLLAVIDTSGSVSNEQLKTFWEEISLASQHTSGFWLMECDVRIQSTRWMRPGEPIPEIGAGRGGTSFAPPFEAIPTLHPRPTVCAYLSDGEGWAPETSPANLTTFWVIDNPYNKDLPVFPGERFGEVIQCQNKR